MVTGDERGEREMRENVREEVRVEVREEVREVRVGTTTTMATRINTNATAPPQVKYR